MVFAYSGLNQGIGSRPEIEVRSQQRERQILATRPAVSDKALASWLCRKELPQRQKVVKQVKCLLGVERVQYVQIRASRVVLVVKNLSANAGAVRTAGSISGREDPMEEGMATHSSTLAWRLPWTEDTIEET